MTSTDDGGDAAILTHINDLVAEEKRLRSEHAAHPGLDQDGRARLQAVEQELDQYWDLLRQRRAREEFDENPAEAHERSVNEVEGYLQ